jgi:catechol 2,3-dioxygenase-like lactoylglutathione lyase family enzyme
VRFAHVTLAASSARISALVNFYGRRLGLTVGQTEAGRIALAIGETTLELASGAGEPFYHVALLVPGDRFDAALAWARDRIELLGDVFQSDDWDSRAVYFHDPAGSILELIAHHGLEENGRSGEFAAEELVGFSELGIVGDKTELLRRLGTSGLQMWDGTVEAPNLLAFVGEKGRTFILAPPGRGWMPTDRPAEAHPVAAVVESQQQVRFEL